MNSAAEALFAGVMRLVQAGSTAAVQSLLREMPALLANNADERLSALIRTERLEDLDARQEAVNCACLAARRFLAACRAVGSEAALREAVLPIQDAFPLAELIRLVEQDQQPARRAALAERALACLRLESEPSWWAEMQYLKASALYKADPFDEKHLSEAARTGGLALQTWLEVGNETNWEETLHLLDDVWRAYGRLDPPRTLPVALDFFEAQRRQPRYQTRPVEMARLLISTAGLYCQAAGAERPEKIKQGIRTYQEAMRLLERMDAATPEAKAEREKDMAMVSTNLGHACLSLLEGSEAENIQLAFRHYEAALAVFSPQREPLRWAEAQFGMAAACRRRGNGAMEQPAVEQPAVEQPAAESWLARGIRHANQALEVYTRAAQPYHWARTQFMLATLYGQADGPKIIRSAANLHKAVEHYQAALEVFDPQKQRYDWGQAHNSLGNVYADLAGFEDAGRNLQRAIEHYQQALKVRTREREPQYYAETHNNLGTVYADLWSNGMDFLGQVHAERHYREAIQVRQAAAFPLGARQSGLNLGQMYFAVGNWRKALEGFELALEGARVIYEASATLVGKKAELQQNAVLHRMAAYAAAMSGNAARGLFLLEQGKTRLLHEQLQAGAVRPGGVSDALWERRQRAAEHMLGARTVEEESQQFQNLRDEQIRERADWARELEQVNREIRAIDPTFLPELRPEDLRGAVSGSDTALVAFCVTEAGAMGFILAGGSGKVSAVPVKGFNLTRLNALIFPSGAAPDRGWVGAYRACSSDELAVQWPPVMDGVLEALSRELVQPVIERLPDNIRRLIILPGGGLFLIPFHALRVRVRGGSEELLGKRFTVRYTPSIKLMMRSGRASQPAREARLTAMINPREVPKGLVVSEKRQSDHLAYAGLMEGALAGLAGPMAAPPKILRGAKCSLDALARLAPEADVLHFYAHGGFDWQQPANSALLLAGKDRLTLEHLRTGQVDLAACRLVTLTACETGIPETEQLPEEYTSLPAGFLLAGAPCVISALWKVHEVPSALLQGRFYELYFGGASPAEALSEAQAYLRTLTYRDLAAHKLIRSRAFAGSSAEAKTLADTYTAAASGETNKDPQEQPFAHPFYWAAFTVMGAG